MKRSALFILMVVYLLSSTGLAVNSFYCCGKLASTTLSYGAADGADKIAAKGDMCCKNTKQNFKIKDHHLTAGSFALNHPVSPVISLKVGTYSSVTVSALRQKFVYHVNAPPGATAIPVYTLNCTYRI